MVIEAPLMRWTFLSSTHSAQVTVLAHDKPEAQARAVEILNRRAISRGRKPPTEWNLLLAKTQPAKKYSRFKHLRINRERVLHG